MRASLGTLPFAVLVTVASCSGNNRPTQAGYNDEGDASLSDSGGGGDDLTIAPGNTDDESTGHEAASSNDGAGGEASSDASDDSGDSTVAASSDAQMDVESDAETGGESMDVSAETGVEASVDGPAGDGNTCVTPDDDSGAVMMMCGSSCVNIETDKANCGGCTQPCTLTGASCVGGHCDCPSGQTNCSGTCTDTTTDPSNCGTCGHTCQGGTCSASACQATGVVSQTGSVTAALIDSLAVDSSDVFWTERPIGASPSDWGVYGFPISGSITTMGQFFGATGDPRGIALSQQNIYWVDYDTGSVNYIGKNGGTQNTLLSMSGATSPPGSLGIAVDTNNVYWVNSLSGEVYQMPIHGTSPVQIAQGAAPWAIAVDSTYVFWLDNGATATTGTVNRVPIGGSPSENVVLASSQDQPYGIALQIDTDTLLATNVFWTNQSDANGAVSSVSAVPVDGGAPITVIAKNQGAPRGVAVDSLYVYWTNYDDNTVLKAPLDGPPDGGSAFQLASQQTNPTAIAVDTKNVYWVAQGLGLINKVAK